MNFPYHQNRKIKKIKIQKFAQKMGTPISTKLNKKIQQKFHNAFSDHKET